MERLIYERTPTAARSTWLAVCLLLGSAPATAQIPRTADGKRISAASGRRSARPIGTYRTTRRSRRRFTSSAPSAPCRAVGASCKAIRSPYQPRAAEKKRANFLNRLTEDPEVKCYMPGVPRATYLPFPLQIVQTPRDVFIAYEFANADRKINMSEPTETPVRHLDGLVERPLGRRYARRGCRRD